MFLGGTWEELSFVKYKGVCKVADVRVVIYPMNANGIRRLDGRVSPIIKDM